MNAAPRFIATATLSAVLLGLTPACDRDGEAAAPIPAPLRGAYGRDVADAYFPTLGLEVDVDTLRFSELTVKIVAGKELPNGSYQVDEAQLRWAKDAGTKDPKKCKGTIDRHGTRLLLTLFKTDGEGKCEVSLEGDWEAWSLVDGVPPSMAGSYGRPDPYAAAEGVRLEGKQLVPTGANEVLVLDEVVKFASETDRIILRKGSFAETSCRGSIEVHEGQLRGTLEPFGDGSLCPTLFGHRWSNDTSTLPKGTLSNGKVTLEIREGTAVLRTVDEQRLECEQAVLRIAQRSVTKSGRDGIPVLGGKVLVLEDAKPTSGSSACADRLGGLATAQCEAYLGVPCDDAMLGSVAHAAQDVTCPTHIILGDSEGGGRKVALLPQSLENAVCWELREPLATK